MKKKTLALIFLLLSLSILSACTSQPAPETAQPEPETKENIQDSNSEAQTVSWQLVQGTPPSADPTPIIYEGQVELSGWIEEKTVYGNEKLPHFHISDKALVPSHLETQDFLLINNEGQLLEQQSIELIKTKSEAMPVTILVDQLKISMEGSPSLRFVKIVD
ncbi:hypothetical protein HY605_05785 [Candidatus Peregrinibacteria bacterium]|nr:hypothetical protein [Candidatus Peregrinibacteria bacterium]